MKDKRIEAISEARVKRMKLWGAYFLVVVSAITLPFQAEYFLPDLWLKFLFLVVFAGLLILPPWNLWRSRRLADSALAASLRGAHETAVEEIISLNESDWVFPPPATVTATVLLGCVDELLDAGRWEEARSLLFTLRALGEETIPEGRMLLAEGLCAAGQGERDEARALLLLSRAGLAHGGVYRARAEAALAGLEAKKEGDPAR